MAIQMISKADASKAYAGATRHQAGSKLSDKIKEGMKNGKVSQDKSLMSFIEGAVAKFFSVTDKKMLSGVMTAAMTGKNSR